MLDLLQERLKELNSREGIVLVGFPRDIIQAQNFEEKVKECFVSRTVHEGGAETKREGRSMQMHL